MRIAELAELAAFDREALTALRGEGAYREVLVELVQTSCLLELSKLAAASVDLGSFTRSAVDVFAQFLPVRGCRLRIAPPGLPTAEAQHGTIESADVATAPVMMDGRSIGELAVSVDAEWQGTGEFFGVAAAQLSACLLAVTERERLRRQAATATALRLAASLDDPGFEETLEALTDALAAIGNATGCRVRVEHPIVGAPAPLVAGVTGNVSTLRVLEFSLGGMSVEVSWAVDPDEEELATLDQVMATVLGSITRGDEARRLREEIEIDPLTGVGNRRRGSRTLSGAIARALRQDEPLAVMALDLDHFKQINDALGHAAGDQVLQSFAAMLMERTRAYDTVVRTGGEEFLIIAPGLDAVSARNLAERLRRATPERCAAPTGAEPAPLPTVSIGIAVFPEVGHTPDRLVRAADEALYQAKRHGRDMVVVSTADPDEPITPIGRRRRESLAPIGQPLG